MKILAFATTLLAGVLVLAFPAWADKQGTVLVTGANRGLGLEFVKQLQAQGYTYIKP